MDNKCCPVVPVSCSPWDLANQPKTNCYADSLNQETLNIAGATVNVHKLLGIHEQTKLVDSVGLGKPISGGFQQGYPALNAFNTLQSEWKSLQTGVGVIASAYIGYDFGEVKLPNGRVRYGVEANVYKHITTIKIKQGSNKENRCSRVRVERSNNGIEWFGVAIVNLPDNDALNTVNFKHSVPSRYWRLRPVLFAGVECNTWVVQAIELIEYSATHVDNIQDMILLENRNRDYATETISLKGYYDLTSNNTDLSRFGIEIPTSNYQIKINFSACVALLGRPIVIGDIIELPSEAQYTPTLQTVKKYLEVTDVTWDSTSYTPGWLPLMLLVSVQPAMASEETQSVFGDLAATVDSSGLFDGNDGNNAKYQDFAAVTQNITAKAKEQVPERGSEGSNTIREFSEEDYDAAGVNASTLNKMQFRRNKLYVEDAMPQNGENYTEGPTFPASPTNGAYHRVTQEGLAKDVPARLYRWSTVKNKWIYLETDRRAQYNATQPVLQEYRSSPTQTPANKIR